MSSNGYKPVIGFEIHVQLATKSKMFGVAANNADETRPNVNIDEVNTGQPGTLPVANKEAIRLAAMVGLALNCQIDEYSKFDRKHYFYPDLPKGYQISQYDRPIAKKGYLDITITASNPHPADAGHPLPKGEGKVLASPRVKRIGITRAHLEEDAGKNIHPEGLSYSLVEPLQEAGIHVTNLDGLTGLPEYRNGGLFLDGGLLSLLDPSETGEGCGDHDSDREESDV